MDGVLNGGAPAKPVVSDRKRQPANDEPPVLSRCEDASIPVDQQAEPCSSPPSLLRETYVTRNRSSDLKKPLFSSYKLQLQRHDKSYVDRRNGATAGFGKVALRLLNKRKKRKQRKHLQKRKNSRIVQTESSERRTTRSRSRGGRDVRLTPLSCENSVSSVDLEVAPGTSRILRPRKSELYSQAALGESVKLRSNLVHALKEAFVKDKPIPEEIDIVDGIEILGFSTLQDLQKFTDAEEALKGPVHISDEEIDVEYYSDLEEDPSSNSVIVSNTLNSFSLSDNSRMSLFDSSDGEVDRSVSRNECESWNMKDVADEASCSSSKHATTDRPSKSVDKPEMPKVGQIVELGLGRPLRPESARNIHCLIDQSGTISRKLAEFSAAVVTHKSKQGPKSRMVMPVVCPKMLNIMRYRWAIGDHGQQVTLSGAKAKHTVPKAGTSVEAESSFPQLKKMLMEVVPSQSGERTKRKAETIAKKAAKKSRMSREATATKAEAASKNDDDIEVLEIVQVKKVSEVAKDSAETSKSVKTERVFSKIEKPPKEVENIVSEILDFVELREQVIDIPFDPDQSAEPVSPALSVEEEESAPLVTKLPVQKKPRAGLLCELRRLDVNLVDMDEEQTEVPDESETAVIEENCKKDICRLGCICESLAGRRATMPTHCGRVDCMFECSCTSICYERRSEGRHLLDVSDATLAWIQDESERNLAKVERQFKQTVVRAKDDLIVMGSKRSRREIKIPERYRENFYTNKDSFIFFDGPKVAKKGASTSTPPLTPTNKSLSPTKLITPPKVPPKLPAPPQRPKFTDVPDVPISKDVNMEEPPDEEKGPEDTCESKTKPCSVLLYQMNLDGTRTPRRNIAVKSTSKVLHTHNVLQSSARTSCKFSENHRLSKRNGDKISSLWNKHSENEMFCQIIKENSISPEEWEKSGELAEQKGDEAQSPLKKNSPGVQLIPWSYLRDKFKRGEYFIWYKCQGGNKHKLYLTDTAEKPNKACVNLLEVDESISKDLPPMISKLIIKSESSEIDEKDARCFIKSVGDFWMIAGYMQRTTNDGAPGSSVPTATTPTTPPKSKTSEEEFVDVDDRQAIIKSVKSLVKAQARWWLLHLTKTFDLLAFYHIGVTVKYSQIEKTAALANSSKSGSFIRMSLRKNSSSKFGLYGVPGMPDCVLIGPYTLDQTPGFKAYSRVSPLKKQFVRVPIYCANKDSEYDLETRKIATPEWLLKEPHRVLGTWLYDFKSLEPQSGRSDEGKYLENSVSDNQEESGLSEVAEKNILTPMETKSALDDLAKPKTQNQMPKKSPSVPATGARVKVRPGQSLLKSSDELKSVDKKTISVKIDGKAKEAVVHIEEDIESPTKTEGKDESKRGKLKIRQDLMRASTPLPASPAIRAKRPSASSRKNSSEEVINVEDDDDVSVVNASRSNKKAEKDSNRDYIVSNIKNLGYIPVTYVSEKSVYIPHLTVPGQVQFFQTHDEVVRHVYKTIRQKVLFIGVRPDTITWRQVDTLDDEDSDKQFNPVVLTGNYVITKAGLINLVKLTEEEIPSLKLPLKDAEELANRLDNLKSLPLLRQLGRLLVGDKGGPMPQNAIVFMAVSEIQKLKAEGQMLKVERKRLLTERNSIKAKVKEGMKDLPQTHLLKVQKQIDSLDDKKDVIVLDEDSESEQEERPASASRVEFAVSEMVSLSSDENEEEERVPRKATVTVSTVQSVGSVGRRSSSTISATEAVSGCTVASVPSTSSSTKSLPSQSLICKFPLSPLKRVNVTVKEDGIVKSPSPHSLIQLNQPIRALRPDGNIIKTIKILDPSTLKSLPTCQTRILHAQPRAGAGASIIRPALKPAPGVVPQRFPILRAMPRGAFPANSDVRPRAVIMTRGGTAVPMTVVKPKPGESFMKLVTPNNEKVFLTSGLPAVKSTADLKASGLKVLHPNVPVTQRLSSPPKPSIIRILKPMTSSQSSGDNSVKVLLSPKKTAPSLVPSPSAGIAEIDTTELVID